MRSPHYQIDRRELPVDPARPDTNDEASRASERALELARRSGSRDLYWYVYQLAHFDPCRGAWRTDYYQTGVDRLLGLGRAKGAQIDALLGCDEPKLLVAADVRIAHSPNEARERVREATHGAHWGGIVIQLAAGSEGPPPERRARDARRSLRGPALHVRRAQRGRRSG